MSIKQIEIPQWAFYTVAGVVALVALVWVIKATGGDGPRDPSTFPKEAYQPPSYAGSNGGNYGNPGASKYGGYTKDGQPVR